MLLSQLKLECNLKKIGMDAANSNQYPNPTCIDTDDSTLHSNVPEDQPFSGLKQVDSFDADAFLNIPHPMDPEIEEKMLAFDAQANLQYEEAKHILDQVSNMTPSQSSNDLMAALTKNFSHQWGEDNIPISNKDRLLGDAGKKLFFYSKALVMNDEHPSYVNHVVQDDGHVVISDIESEEEDGDEEEEGSDDEEKKPPAKVSNDSANASNDQAKATNDEDNLEVDGDGRVLIEWQPCLKFAVKYQRFKGMLESRGFKNTINLPAHLYCDCCPIKPRNVHIPEPKIWIKINDGVNWAFQHIIQSYLTILQHEYIESLKNKQTAIAPCKYII